MNLWKQTCHEIHGQEEASGILLCALAQSSWIYREEGIYHPRLVHDTEIWTATEHDGGRVGKLVPCCETVV